MPAKKASAAALLAENLLRLLRQRCEQGQGELLTLATLARMADPAAGPRAVLGVLYQRRTFGPLVVAARRDLDAPVALIEDMPRLAASPQLLEYALRCVRTASNHAASLAELKRKLTVKLQAPFQEAVQQQMQQATLPPSVGWLLIKSAKKQFLLSDVHQAQPGTRSDGEPARPTRDAINPPLSISPSPHLDFTGAFEDAFSRLDRQAGGYNFVSLADLRPAVPCDRAVFDTGLRELRLAGRYTLSAAEGRHGLTLAEREAGVNEDGTLLLFVSRKAP